MGDGEHALPAAVSATPRAERSSTRAPTVASTRCTDRDTEACVVRSAIAASVKVPSAQTAANARR